MCVCSLTVGPTDFVTARKRSSKTDLFFIKAFFRLADSILHGFVEENPPEIQPAMDYRRIDREERIEEPTRKRV